MKTKKIYIIPVSLLLIFVLISGCSDSTTTPPVINSGNVNGKVIDVSGAAITGATVIIGNTIAVSGADGSFTISGVTSPYNIKILVNSGSTPTGMLYQGLTTFSPQLFFSGSSGQSSSSALNVTIPALGADQRALVIFTDNGNIHTSNEISSPSMTANLNVKWPTGASITGKIIVLTYTFTAGQISLFNKYGEMSFTLNNGGASNVTFTPAQLSVTPQQSSVSGTLNLPAGYSIPKTKLLLRFSSSASNISSGALIGNEIMGNNFNFVIPANLTSSFNIGLEGQGSGPIGEFTLKLDTIHAGVTGKVLTLESAPSLNTPPNGQSGVDTATNFTYTAGSGAGVYLTSFNGTGRSFLVISNSTSVTIPNFSSIGLPIGTNIPYTWVVTKINFASMDSFVSGPLLFSSAFNSETASSSRTFTTGP